MPLLFSTLCRRTRLPQKLALCEFWWLKTSSFYFTSILWTHSIKPNHLPTKQEPHIITCVVWLSGLSHLFDLHLTRVSSEKLVTDFENICGNLLPRASFFMRKLMSSKNVLLRQQSIHPSIFYTVNPSVGSRGGWSLSQQSSGERRGTPWTGRQSITGPHRDKRDKQPHTLTPKDNF